MLIHSMNSAVKAVETYSKVQTKANAYKALCRLRTAGVSVIIKYNETKAKYHAIERRKAKAAEVLPSNIQIKLYNPYKSILDARRKEMCLIGNMMFLLLDDWQKLGATFRELCNLCNISEKQGKNALGECGIDDFSEMLFVCNLDYKNSGDFIEDIPEAPFTICIKEFMLDQMLNTEHGAKAAHEALQAVLPEIWGSDIISSTPDGGFQYTDENGEIHHIDKDGVEI